MEAICGMSLGSALICCHGESAARERGLAGRMLLRVRRQMAFRKTST